MTRHQKLHLEKFLPYRLSVLSNTVSSAIAAAYFANFGLSIPEWRVMAVLAANPGLSAAEVTARTAMDKVAVSRAVATLLGAGRLRRTTVPADRRRTHLQLTTAGERVYAQVVPMALEYERRLVASLSKRDRATLDRTLRVLLGRAVELGPAHAP
jgi:DNA-binding MarR family transcriptional regulator